MSRQCAQEWIEDLSEQGGEIRSCDGVVFEDEEGGKGAIAPEFSVLQVTCEAEEDEEDDGACVEG